MKSRDSKKINAIKMWVWRRSIRIPWTAIRTNESILIELNIKKGSLPSPKNVLWASSDTDVRSPRHKLEKLIIAGRIEVKRAETRWSDLVQKVVGGCLYITSGPCHPGPSTVEESHMWSRKRRKSTIAKVNMIQSFSFFSLLKSNNEITGDKSPCETARVTPPCLFVPHSSNALRFKRRSSRCTVET